jgi:hypothetical protein
VPHSIPEGCCVRDVNTDSAHITLPRERDDVWHPTVESGASMKRRALKLVVFLLLGAIINVAVAWGCQRWNAFGYLGVPLVFREKIVIISPPSELEYIPHAKIEGWAFGIHRVRYYGVWKHEPWKLHDQDWLEVHCAGWPLFCLCGETWTKAAGQPNSTQWMCTVNRNSCDSLVFPLRPLWPGFAINTIFYAAVLWVLFAVPGRVRRWRRIKRGVCVRCAYPVGASDVCTECGTPRNAVPWASPPATPA